MHSVFDDISRTVASGESRRHVLKIIASTLVGAAFFPLGARHAQGQIECSDGSICPESNPLCCGGGLCCPTDRPNCCPSANICCPENTDCPDGTGDCVPRQGPRCGGSHCDTNQVCCEIIREGFTFFECLESCPPTAIELLSFTAEAHADGTVTLGWETATEVDNAGFDLYRTTAEGGPYTKITSTLIPAQGDLVAGASYSYVDSPGSGTFRYILADVDASGEITLHGPVMVEVAVQ